MPLPDGLFGRLGHFTAISIVKAGGSRWGPISAHLQPQTEKPRFGGRARREKIAPIRRIRYSTTGGVEAWWSGCPHRAAVVSECPLFMMTDSHLPPPHPCVTRFVSFLASFPSPSLPCKPLAGTAGSEALLVYTEEALAAPPPATDPVPATSELEPLPNSAAPAAAPGAGADEEACGGRTGGRFGGGVWRCPRGKSR